MAEVRRSPGQKVRQNSCRTFRRDVRGPSGSFSARNLGVGAHYLIEHTSSGRPACESRIPGPEPAGSGFTRRGWLEDEPFAAPGLAFTQHFLPDEQPLMTKRPGHRHRDQGVAGVAGGVTAGVVRVHWTWP